MKEEEEVGDVEALNFVKKIGDETTHYLIRSSHWLNHSKKEKVWMRVPSSINNLACLPSYLNNRIKSLTTTQIKSRWYVVIFFFCLFVSFPMVSFQPLYLSALFPQWHCRKIWIFSVDVWFCVWWCTFVTATTFRNYVMTPHVLVLCQFSPRKQNKPRQPKRP